VFERLAPYKGKRAVEEAMDSLALAS